ncbi:MAG: hypothetical protein JWN86_402 [Planctomycetota bacterium]|nr:hypothetical protein [Planctomycetota bacterium]
MPRRLTLLLVLESLMLSLFRLAADARFDWFGFFDGGAELTVHALMARGMRPTLDFGYIYGLLPLGAGDLWYRIVGRSPGAFVAVCVVGNLLSAWGFARCLTALRVGPIGVAWVMLAMPVGLVSSAYPSLTHIMERVILTHALADVAAGRRSRALTLAATCVFVKPSMAFLFGAGVLAGQFVHQRHPGFGEVVSFVRPAVTTFFTLAILLGVVFGPEVLLNSLLPRDGYEVYRANQFGFLFGAGRAFWLPRRPGIGPYFETEAGLWLAATLVLLLAAPAQFSAARRARALHEGRVGSGAEVVILCAALHLAFLVLFFGNEWSWVYYFNILTLGVAAVGSRSRVGSRAVLIVMLLSLPAIERSIRGPTEAWQDRRRSTETWALWASPVAREEWRTVLDLTRGTRPVLLATTDGAALLDPAFEPPEVAFLVRGHYKRGELARKLEQVREASAVVVYNPAPGAPWFDQWPEFAQALQGHRRIWSCSRLRVYRHAGASSSSSKKSR